MNELNNSIFINNYLDFVCTGAECIESCCNTWNIEISASMYQQYQDLPESEFKKFILENTYKDKNTNEIKIKFKDDGKCPILDEDSLCSIQKNLGSSYLNYNCHNYPRTIKSFNSKIECSLNSSCPEVVKNYILTNKPILFEISKLDLREIKDSNVYKFSPILSSNIRTLSINILNNRNMTLMEKLHLFGFTMNDLNSFINQSKNEMEISQKILKLSQSYQDYNFVKKIYNVSAEYQIDNELKIKFYKLISSLIPYPKYILYNFEFYDRFSNINNPYVMDNILIHKKRLLDDYISKNPYNFSNYLILTMFTKPFTTNKNSLDIEFKAVLLRFIFVEIFISILYFDKQFLTDEDVLNVIYYTSRRFDHREECLFSNFCVEHELDLGLCLSLL